MSLLNNVKLYNDTQNITESHFKKDQESSGGGGREGGEKV